MKLVVRTIPPWESELIEELEEVIREKAEERDIKYEFVDDSEQISKGINKIRHAMQRLDSNQTKYENRDKAGKTGEKQ